MDNDNKIKKALVSIYKDIRFKVDYKYSNVKNEVDGNQLIYDELQKGNPIMISRFGATEMRCIDFYLKNKKFNEKILREIKELSGVYPNTPENIKKFCEFYLKCISDSDVIALWGVKNEKKVINSYGRNLKLVKLKSLEPYYFNNPWSKYLQNKKVLVIHPFAKSIIKQYKNRDKLFENNYVLPKFKSLDTVKAIQSIANEVPEYETWFDAYENMCNEIKMKDFDVAIIGAGAYGLPLASFIKGMGKQSIHIAGATQILFGIKGKRWDKHEYISTLFNDYWVRPSDEETPNKSDKVEGGSYW